MALTTDAAGDDRFPSARARAEEADQISARAGRKAELLVAAVILVTFGSLVVGAGFGWSNQRVAAGDIPMGAPLLTGYILQAIGIVVGVSGLGWALYHRQFPAHARSSILFPDRHQDVRDHPQVHQRILEHIRTGDPVPDPRSRRSAITIASQHRRVMLCLTPLITGMTLIDLGAGITSQHPFVLALALATAVLLGVAFVNGAAHYRRAGVFLERCAAPGSTRR